MILTSPITPTIFRHLTREMREDQTVCMAIDVWNDILTDSDFDSLIDPETKREWVLTGQLGGVLGRRVETDGFWLIPVMRPHEILILDPPELAALHEKLQRLNAETGDRHDL